MNGPWRAEGRGNEAGKGNRGKADAEAREVGEGGEGRGTSTKRRVVRDE